MATVALLGTCDTKLVELLYLREQILQNEKINVIMLDVGRSNVDHAAINLAQTELVSRYGGGRDPAKLPRAEVIKLMTECASGAVQELVAKGTIHGIVSAGGSGGTSLVAPVMRALPIGFPKLIVSTVASGDTGPIVGESDITMMYSVVDVASLNQVLRDVLANAGAAIAGAALSYAARQIRKLEQGTVSSPEKKRVGITMFGVTTPGVDAIRRSLEENYPVEIYAFHATGHGGKAMERLVREGRLDAVLDLTTTELSDLITGGTFSAGPGRLDAAVEAGIPNIVSLGACDMTNWGPRETVPERYQGRKLYEHNPVTTLMRTDRGESRKIGEFMVGKLRRASKKDMVQVWIPKGGISMIAVPGGPFEDTEADEELFETLRAGLKGSGIKVVEDERTVNDEGFARNIAKALVELMGLSKIDL